jgi:hypothetical protein
VASTLTSESATKPAKIQNDSQVSMTASERKALKKAKQKEKKAKDADLDLTLAEPSIQCVIFQSIRLLRIFSAWLHDMSMQKRELRRFFGFRVVQATKTKSSLPPPRNAGTLQSNLTRPQSFWWSATQREGLSISPLTDEVDLNLECRSWTPSADEK